MPWDQTTEHLHIAKELVPIIIAVVLWGHMWKGGRVIARCDNTAVVAVINSRSSRDSYFMQMLRCLFFIEAYHQFKLSAVQYPNVLADDLSRDKLAAFMVKANKCNSEPSPIPPSLLQWLLHPQMDWTSPNWMRLFSSFAQRV